MAEILVTRAGPGEALLGLAGHPPPEIRASAELGASGEAHGSPPDAA